jgi:DNA-binding NarL/FixJ family response regulator
MHARAPRCSGRSLIAAEAISVTERERPDLVLMDVRLLSERDGIEAATEIWRRFSMRSLFVSANLDAAARHKAAVGFLEQAFHAHRFAGRGAPKGCA